MKEENYIYLKDKLELEELVGSSFFGNPIFIVRDKDNKIEFLVDTNLEFLPKHVATISPIASVRNNKSFYLGEEL